MDSKELMDRVAALDTRAKALNRNAFVVMNVWKDRISISTHCGALSRQDVDEAASIEEALAQMDLNLFELENMEAALARTLGIEP